MKYFTPELYQRGNSANPAVVSGIEEEWERALERYNRRWKKIQSAFPDAVKRFDSSLCLHDARLLSIGKKGRDLLLVAERGSPPLDLVILNFKIEGEPIFTPVSLPGQDSADAVYWLYEEWDLDHQKRCWFEVLLSNGLSVRLCFHGFEYVVAERMLPVGEKPVPRSA